MDEKRLLSIAENKSDYSLSIMANREIMDLVQRMKRDCGNDDLLNGVIAITNDLNYKDNIFREISEFMHDKPHDLLSIGSMVIGELESKTALLDLSGDSD